MATCKKCGQPLAENAVFCHICGTAVEGNIQPERPTRTQVYAGVVKKCPVCGAELPSMAAVCPSCGHEIVSSDMGSFLRAFSESMDKCDQAIVEEEKERRLKAIQNSSGWKSWSKIGKAAWILLNIVTLCLPLVVLYVIKRIRDTLFLPSEKHKISS